MKQFAIFAAKRAAYTFAETAIAMITVGQAFTEIDWLHVVSVSGVAAVVSVLKSILIGMPEVKTDDDLHS